MEWNGMEALERNGTGRLLRVIQFLLMTWSEGTSWPNVCSRIQHLTRQTDVQLDGVDGVVMPDQVHTEQQPEQAKSSRRDQHSCADRFCLC